MPRNLANKHTPPNRKEYHNNPNKKLLECLIESNIKDRNWYVGLHILIVSFYWNLESQDTISIPARMSTVIRSSYVITIYDFHSKFSSTKSWLVINNGIYMSLRNPWSSLLQNI
jgi:hypothetical protein